MTELYTDCYVIKFRNNFFLNTEGNISSFGLNTKLFDSESEAHAFAQTNINYSNISSYNIVRYWIRFEYSGEGPVSYL